MKKEKVLKKQYQGAKIYNNLNEKFLIELRHLAPTIANWWFLDEYEQNVTLHNALIQFTKGVKRKEIDTSEYKNYKGYQYIILTNEIKKANVFYHLTRKAKDNKNESIEELDTSSYSNCDQQEINEYKQQISLLSPFHQQIVQFLIDGYNLREISKLLDITSFYTEKAVKSIRKKIFPDMKMRNFQYQTRAEFHKKRQTPNPSTKYIDYEYDDFYAS